MPRGRRGHLLSTSWLLLLLSAAPAAAQSVWSSTLTVGSPTNAGLFSGYSKQFEYGALDDADFVFDGVSYEVINLSYRVESSGLLITLSSSFVYDGWSLTVGGQTFDLDQAPTRNEELTGILGFTFVWTTDHAFDNWSDGQKVAVSLSGPQSVPALPVPAVGSLLALLTAIVIKARHEHPRR